LGVEVGFSVLVGDGSGVLVAGGFVGRGVGVGEGSGAHPIKENSIKAAMKYIRCFE
jgi:hypothetical protein